MDKGIYFYLYQNKYNLGSDINSEIAVRRTEGSFIYTLASDDAIAPDFIEKCMDIFLKYPKVGTVMTHREEMDENGYITRTPPFYNKSFVIDGESQAAVYMMTGIGIPGQRMIRRSILNVIYAYRRTFQVAGDWYDNFLYTMAGDFAYIVEPLCRYRVHNGNETNVSERNILGVMEHFQIINAFKCVSESFGMTRPAARYDEAVSKLGSMCIRYAHKMLKAGLDDTAFRYLKLAPVFKIDIEFQALYKDLMCCVQLKGNKRKALLSALEESGVLRRMVSYDPPEGYLAL
jgi:hypothetical protein